MASKAHSNKALPLPKQGQIWLVKFPPTKEDRKPIRPCLVISDNIQNQYGKWIVVVPLTTEDIENIESFEFCQKYSGNWFGLFKQTPIKLSPHGWPNQVKRTFRSFKQKSDWRT